MACNDVDLVNRFVKHCCSLVDQVVVADTMKTILSYTILLCEGVGKGIGVCSGGHCLVKGCVKHRNLMRGCGWDVGCAEVCGAYV